jgi:hypothetical protein
VRHRKPQHPDAGRISQAVSREPGGSLKCAFRWTGDLAVGCDVRSLVPRLTGHWTVIMAAPALRRWWALRTLHPSAGNISTVKDTRVLLAFYILGIQPLCSAGLARLAMQRREAS